MISYIRYNICSTWFLNIVISTCFEYCDTKYRTENFTNTDFDTDTNPYRHMVRSYHHLFASIRKLANSYKYFLATTKPNL